MNIFRSKGFSTVSLARQGKPMKYNRVFLSYAGQDIEITRSLALDLKNAGIAVWFDQWEIPKRLTRQEVYPVLHNAVRTCRVGIVVGTRTYSSRLSMMFDEDGRCGATLAAFGGMSRDEAMEVDPPLLFEVIARDYPLDSYSKYIYADFENRDGDKGCKSRIRSAVYESRYTRDGKTETTIGIRSFSGYSASDGRLVGEKVTISFSDYNLGLAGLLEELDLLPGEWMHK